MVKVLATKVRGEIWRTFACLKRISHQNAVVKKNFSKKGTFFEKSGTLLHIVSGDADGPYGTAVGGALCRYKAVSGNGIGDHLRRFALGQGKYLRAEAGTQAAADAGLTVDGCVHKEFLLPLE
jgi:hypothetical protein